MRKLGGATSVFTLSSLLAVSEALALENRFKYVDSLGAVDAAKEEDFWAQIKLAFTTSSTRLDLNSGGVSPQPRVVQEAFHHYYRISNEAPSFYMWRQLDRGRNVIRQRLADMAGVDVETVALTRNATESLETVIFGLRLKAGDEVILSKQGYPNMTNAWKQRAHREGIVLRWLDFELPQENPDYFIDKYRELISDRTRVISITHIINWNGQVLPVKKIIELVEGRNIETVVDGAHSFAHLDFTVAELGCDYFGTSLHKWLCAPFGSGMLYVKRGKIKKLYPLFAAIDPEDDNIRKFENMGTRPSATEQAIVQAIDFHQMIGNRRKEERLRYLKNYWIAQTKDLPGISYQSPGKVGSDCGIGMFSIEGMENIEISNTLSNIHHIHTVAINHEGIHGIRISPNVFTLTSDLDRFTSALRTVVNS